MDKKYLVSACLAGKCCRYDGRDNLVPEIAALVTAGQALPFCPEEASGLTTPRPPCEIVVAKGEAKVYNNQKCDCTAAFRRGAKLAQTMAAENKLTTAILKARSPSCGLNEVYDGSFTGTLRPGHGLTAQALLDAGLTVMTEEEWVAAKGEMMEQKKYVAVLFGGQSGEHEVSLMSAANVLEVIDKNKYEVLTIGITKEGKCLLYTGPYADIPGGAWEGGPTEEISLLGDARLKQVDVFFPILHGPMGEDGTIQGIFEFLGKPYVGCGVAASAVAMDKVFTKMVCQAAGIPTGPYFYFTKGDWEDDRAAIVAEMEKRGYPLFIKPVNMGSSVGITKGHNLDEAVAGIVEALKYDNKIIVEETVDGREIECAVLEVDGRFKAAIPGEIVAAKEFYDYEAKYESGDASRTIIPADLSAAVQKQVMDYSLAAIRAVSGNGLSRVDFFVTADDEVLINEINTMPGFTNISMFPKMWEAAGVGYAELVAILIENASAKRERSYL